MPTLPVIFSALGLFLSASALASTPISSSTLNDIANMQLTLEKAEYEKKLSELRSGTRGAAGIPSATVSSGSSSESDLSVNPTLKGLYGVGKRLYAIVDMGGTEVEFSVGDTYFGYRALSINSLETVLVKLNSKGSSKGGKVYRLRLTGGGDMSAVRSLPPLPSVPMASAAEPTPATARPTPARPARAAGRAAPTAPAPMKE
jgi:type IV pilus biogenesis protein PilP